MRYTNHDFTFTFYTRDSMVFDLHTASERSKTSLFVQCVLQGRLYGREGFFPVECVRVISDIGVSITLLHFVFYAPKSN